MPTIALVDDDRNILTSVSIALEAEGYRIMTYTDGASALDGFKTSPPDLAILDIKMPRMDGMETLRRLRQKSDMPVIFLTSKDEEIDELFGLKMGADDFIRKPFSQRLLVERVKAVLRRATPKDGATPKEVDARALERGQLRMDPERHTCTWKNEPVTLTVTEFLILQALATRPGVVKSRNALMDAAYDDQVYVDDRTIDSHIKRLRKKSPRRWSEVPISSAASRSIAAADFAIARASSSRVACSSTTMSSATGARVRPCSAGLAASEAWSAPSEEKSSAVLRHCSTFTASKPWLSSAWISSGSNAGQRPVVPNVPLRVARPARPAICANSAAPRRRNW